MPDDQPAQRPLSPARAHLQRIAAAAPAVGPADRPSAAGHERELLLAQLYEHTKQLKAIKSVEKKIEAKRAFSPEYDVYLQSVLGAGRAEPDPIVTTLMVWNIDAGRYSHALRLAQHVLAHGLSLPDQYQRDVPTLLADEFSTAALAGHIEPAQERALLADVMALTYQRDMPDQARAKLHKALGYALLGKRGAAEPDLDALPDGLLRDAEAHLLRAIALHAQVGVKKDLERLARRLKDAPPASAPADPRPGGSVGKGAGAKASAGSPKA